MYALIASLVLVNGACIVLLFAFCRPSYAFWDIGVKDARCWDTRVLTYASSVQGCKFPACFRAELQGLEGERLTCAACSMVHIHRPGLHIHATHYDMEAAYGRQPKSRYHGSHWIWVGDDWLLHWPLPVLCEHQVLGRPDVYVPT